MQLGLDKAQYSAGLKGAAGEAKTATGALQGSFNSMAKSLLAVAAPAAVFGAISKFAIDGVKDFVAYNKEVRETSEATGTTAEAVSRLIQVGDDWGIQSGEITGAMKMMTKNGMQPSIENLAKLADEFVNTTDKTAFAEKAAKQLGRNWSTLVPILKDGGQALRDQTAAVSENLLATAESTRKARAYEVAMDNLGDMTTELKYLFADQLLPSVIAVTNATASLGFATLGLSSAAKQGKITWGEYLAQSAKVTWTSYTAADAQKWLADKLAEQRVEVTESTGAFDGYIQRLNENTIAANINAEANADLKYAIIDVGKAAMGREALDALKKAYDDGAISAEEYRARSGLIMSQWLQMPATEVSAGQALTLLKKDFDDGKISIYEYLSGLSGIRSNLDAMNGKTYKTFFELVTSGTNYHYTPPTGGGGGGGGGTTTPTTPAPTGKPGPGQPGFRGARGLDMIVPGGYPNDSAVIRATSGERVTITPAGEKSKAGLTIEGNIIMQITNPIANGEQLYREFKRRLTEDLRAERLRS